MESSISGVIGGRISWKLLELWGKDFFGSSVIAIVGDSKLREDLRHLGQTDPFGLGVDGGMLEIVAGERLGLAQEFGGGGTEE